MEDYNSTLNKIKLIILDIWYTIKELLSCDQSKRAKAPSFPHDTPMWIGSVNLNLIISK